jgi:hypothetical protein
LVSFANKYHTDGALKKRPELFTLLLRFRNIKIGRPIDLFGSCKRLFRELGMLERVRNQSEKLTIGDGEDTE